MRPYIDEMRTRIADTLGIEISQVNVKATTEEGLGFTGSLEGISSQAVCMISSVKELSSFPIGGGCQKYGGCGICLAENQRMEAAISHKDGNN